MTDNNFGFEKADTGKAGNPWALNPKEFLFKYLRYLPLLAVFGVLALLLAYMKVRYSTPVYRLQSSLLIKNDRGGGGNDKDMKFNELFMSQNTDNLDNEIEILKSRAVMQRVAADLNLQVSYYGEGKVKSSPLIYPEPPFKLEIVAMGDTSNSFGGAVTFLNNQQFMLDPNKLPIKIGDTFQVGANRCRITRDSRIDIGAFGSMKYQFGWSPLPILADNLRSGLQVAQINDRSTILTLTFEGENQPLARDILNMLMSVYDSLIVEDKKKIQENTLKFIDAQLYQLSDTLSGVQNRLKNFMVDNQVFDIEGQSKNFLDNLGESAKQQSEQEVKLSIVNWLLNYIGDKKNMYELVPTNLGVEEPVLVGMVADYNRLILQREADLRTTTPNNQIVVGIEGNLDKIRRDIYQALTNVKQAYLIAGANIDRYKEQLQGRVTSLPGNSIHLLNIQRRQKILEDLYSFLLQKKLETQIASASTVSNSRVLEPSIGSGRQVSPDVKKIYTLYLVMGLLIPVGLIAIRELLQDKVNGRADVEKYTTVPILGEIGHSDDKQPLVVAQNSRRLIGEQFRIIRSNLQYIVGKKDRPVIMVTSSFSGEGKSFISTNIGAVMALSGKRTVIMEFDIRKPKIVTGLDLKRKMGITNYIIGKASFEELLLKVDGADNLYVIPCGPIPPNPAELLLDKRLDELMAEVMNHFEVVIMDTAPIGLVSDAGNLGRFADCTLFIVRQGQTFRKQLFFIDDLYREKKLPALSILINDVTADSGYYGGYYSRTYGYYAGYGYGSSGYFEDETGARKKRGFRKLINWLRNSFK
jgi:tyrosine-protein kinase Etk/Wzc